MFNKINSTKNKAADTRILVEITEEYIRNYSVMKRRHS